jgi:hypothetical protein
MGINEIKLTPELIAVWYPETLVTTVDQAPVGETPDSRDGQYSKTLVKNFLGKNLRSIIVLVDSPEAEFMPEAQKIFLQKILAACKYSLDDVAIINIYSHLVTFENLKQQFHPDTIFFWGSLPAIPGLPGHLQDMTVVTWENTKLLYIAQADLMSRDNPEAQGMKRLLWNALQKIFNL